MARRRAGFNTARLLTNIFTTRENPSATGKTGKLRGVLESTGSYNAEGKMHGDWIHYNQDGGIASVRSMYNGVPGDFRAFHPNGKLSTHQHFADGRHIRTDTFDQNGVLTHSVSW